jgi:hypothetical protein
VNVLIIGQQQSDSGDKTQQVNIPPGKGPDQRTHRQIKKPPYQGNDQRPCPGIIVELTQKRKQAFSQAARADQETPDKKAVHEKNWKLQIKDMTMINKCWFDTQVNVKIIQTEKNSGTARQTNTLPYIFALNRLYHFHSSSGKLRCYWHRQYWRLSYWDRLYNTMNNYSTAYS